MLLIWNYLWISCSTLPKNNPSTALDATSIKILIYPNSHNNRQGSLVIPVCKKKKKKNCLHIERNWIIHKIPIHTSDFEKKFKAIIKSKFIAIQWCENRNFSRYIIHFVGSCIPVHHKDEKINITQEHFCST